MFIFFEYMQALSFSISKCLFFLNIYRFERLEVYQSCIYFKKNQYVDAKHAQDLHILKKIKSFDSEKLPNLHILKKIKKKQKSQTLCGTDWHR